jgi:hypothetical protein
MARIADLGSLQEVGNILSRGIDYHTLLIIEESRVHISYSTEIFLIYLRVFYITSLSGNG